MGNIFSHRKNCWIPHCPRNGFKKFGGRCHMHQNANICQFTKCNGLAYDLKRFCPECNCIYPDCDMLAIKNGQAQYCLEHYQKYYQKNTCIIDGCSNITKDNDVICAIHRCSYDNCKKIIRKGLFCPNHTCQMGNCDKSVYGNYSFCYAHYNLIENGSIQYNLHYIPTPSTNNTYPVYNDLVYYDQQYLEPDFQSTNYIKPCKPITYKPIKPIKQKPIKQKPIEYYDRHRCPVHRDQCYYVKQY
uniref:Uncharacterized protein n=1 Tax=viral metagenome TaxID=1070528 RepID=A0A6C0E7E4_9ZZZZ